MMDVRIPRTNAVELDKLLNFVLEQEPRKRFTSDTEIRKVLFPHKTVDQVCFIIDEILAFQDGLLRTNKLPVGDDNKGLIAGPRLADFMFEGGFSKVFTRRLELDIKEQEDKELERKSKQAAIDAVEISRKSNALAKQANWISGISATIAIAALVISMASC